MTAEREAMVIINTWLISWEVIFSFIFGFVINVGVLVFIYIKNILSMYI